MGAHKQIRRADDLRDILKLGLDLYTEHQLLLDKCADKEAAELAAGADAAALPVRLEKIAAKAGKLLIPTTLEAPSALQKNEEAQTIRRRSAPRCSAPW